MDEAESKLITTEEFYAAALIKFEWLDNFDIILLMEDLKKSGFKFLNKKSYELDKYMIADTGITSLKSNYTLDTKVASKIFGIITLRQKLRMMVSDEIQDFFDNIDLIYFVLRKMKYLGRPKVDLELFNPLEQGIIMELITRGFCLTEYSDDTELDVSLSQLGNLEIFLKANSSLVETFKTEARNVGFSSEDVDRYLLGVNLTRNINNILDLARLKRFYASLNGQEKIARS